MAKLSTKERNKLDDSDFGLPDKRMYPLHDKAHVESAVKLFGHCPKEDKPRLARRILEKAKEYGMDSSGWDEVNKWAKEGGDEVKQESFVDKYRTRKPAFGMQKATKDDIDFIAEMEMMTVSEQTKRDYPNTEKFIRKDAQKSWKHTWLIWLGSEPNVYSGIYQAYPIDDGEWWYIAEIALKPECRGKGIGTWLITEDMLKHDKIVLCVDMYNTKARRLYERLGFKKTDKEQNRYIMRWEKSDTVQESSRVAVADSEMFNLIKNIVKNIHQKVKADRKPPTGNQNCMLCTWCLEAQMRGIPALPRPVYSPRDPLFTQTGEGHDGYNIVINPEKVKIKSFNNLMQTMLLASPTTTSRWYIHVNWKDSTGGHEFMLFRLNETIAMCDPQCGFIEKIHNSTSHPITLWTLKDQPAKVQSYFNDVNYENSYIVRLDDKEFNRRLFDKMNNPSMTLPWDPDKDIPYMKEQGMLGDDEDEEDMNEHYDDLSIHESYTDDLSKIQEFFDSMADYNYGFYADGKVYAGDMLNSDTYDKKYRLMSSDEIRDHKVCVCWDACRYEAEWFKDTLPNIPVKVYYCEYENRIGNTHTWLTFELDDGWYVFEHTWYAKRGVKKISNLGEFINQYIKDIPKSEHSDSELKDAKYVLIEYNPLDEPTGINCVEFMDMKWDKGKLVQTNCDNESEMMEKFGFNDDEKWRMKFKVNPIQESYQKLSEELIPVENYKHDTVYLGMSDSGFRKKKVYFVTPYMGVASIFAAHDVFVQKLNEMGLHSFNSAYDEWNAPVKYLKEPLHTVHVKIRSYEGKTFKKFEVTGTGYIFAIDISDLKDNIYVYPWMIKSREVLIANKQTVPVTACYPIEVKYIVEPEETVQESYEIIQEGTTYRDKHFRKLYFHVSGDEHLDGQVFKPRVPKYIEPGDTADTSTEFEDATIPRVCFAPTIEGAMNAIICKINPQYPVPYKRLAVYVPEKPFNDYKHKTNKEIIKEKLVFDASSTGEVWIMEPVRMKLFGIIEIDSYKRAKMVSNVKNNRGDRSQKRYYIFKWHWLVNPKIFDDKNRPKYDVNSVITNLCYDLPKFRYGLIKDGRVTNNASESDYNKYWVVHTGEEVDQAGGGNCYDMVEYEAGYLEAYGIPCKKYFLAMQYKNKHRTHTFIVVENNGKYIYIEGAFKRVIDEIGYSKEFDNLNDIFDYVLECSCEYDNVPEFAYGIFDYTDDTPTPGTPIQNFEKYIADNGKLVREGTFKFKKKE